MSIIGFADKGTADIWNGVNSKQARKALPTGLWPTAVIKLDRIDACDTTQDLRVPPGNRFEALKGDLAGHFSIRINDQYRIVFKFEGGNASEVQITDYH